MWVQTDRWYTGNCLLHLTLMSVILAFLNYRFVKKTSVKGFEIMKSQVVNVHMHVSVEGYGTVMT